MPVCSAGAGGLLNGSVLERTAVRALCAIQELGAVAQLGERLICTQEVAGSIPTSSTSFDSPSGL